MRALTSPSARSDVFMFFGIDCTHVTCSRERPSIAAVIGSKDSTSTQYTGRVVQQFSPKGKIALEIIKDLHILVGELIREFSNHNSQLPNKLVFYRAGVDDGAFQKVLDNELRAIQRACSGNNHWLPLRNDFEASFFPCRIIWSQSITPNLFCRGQETTQHPLFYLGQTIQSNK